MRVFVLGSGSSGNALLVESCGTRVMIDAGIGPKVAAGRLAELGVDLRSGALRGPRRRGELHGIVATHHHGDHFGHAHKLASTFAAPLFLHPGIAAPAPTGPRRGRSVSWTTDSAPPSGIPDGPTNEEPASEPCSSRAARHDEPLDIQRYDLARPFRVGALTITAVQVPHDAAQVAVRIDDGASAFGVATDVGRVTSGLVSLLGECDAALVEANHCTELLAFSEYPDVVKRRVGGGWGHLSNTQTAELAARLVGSRLARLWLGHLSRSNNTPARALETVATRAKRIDVDVIPGESPVALDVRATKPYQLGLPF